MHVNTYSLHNSKPPTPNSPPPIFLRFPNFSQYAHNHGTSISTQKRVQPNPQTRIQLRHNRCRRPSLANHQAKLANPNPSHHRSVVHRPRPGALLHPPLPPPHWQPTQSQIYRRLQPGKGADFTSQRPRRHGGGRSALSM